MRSFIIRFSACLTRLYSSSYFISGSWAVMQTSKLIQNWKKSCMRLVTFRDRIECCGLDLSGSG
jgi:hypothetical protein